MSFSGTSIGFAYDNKSLIFQGQNISEAALPVNIGANTDYLTAEVHQLARVVCRFSDSPQIVTKRLWNIESTQLQSLQLLQQQPKSSTDGIGAQTDIGTDVENNSINRPVHRIAEVKNTDSENVMITLQVEKKKESTCTFAKETARQLLKKTQDFDMQQIEDFWKEKGLNIFVLAKRLQKNFPTKKGFGLKDSLSLESTKSEPRKKTKNKSSTTATVKKQK